MRKTTYVRCIIAVSLAVAAGGFGSRLGVGAAPNPERLTPATFEAIKARVTPTPQELAWQQVRWRDGFFEGLLEAQAADRPLFYWLYEGDPRGNC
jgi:hypothetical protein